MLYTFEIYKKFRNNSKDFDIFKNAVEISEQMIKNGKQLQILQTSQEKIKYYIEGVVSGSIKGYEKIKANFSKFVSENSRISDDNSYGPDIINDFFKKFSQFKESFVVKLGVIEIRNFSYKNKIIDYILDIDDYIKQIKEERSQKGSNSNQYCNDNINKYFSSILEIIKECKSLPELSIPQTEIFYSPAIDSNVADILRMEPNELNETQLRERLRNNFKRISSNNTVLDYRNVNINVSEKQVVDNLVGLFNRVTARSNTYLRTAFIVCSNPRNHNYPRDALKTYLDITTMFLDNNTIKNYYNRNENNNFTSILENSIANNVNQIINNFLNEHQNLEEIHGARSYIYDVLRELSNGGLNININTEDTVHYMLRGFARSIQQGMPLVQHSGLREASNLERTLNQNIDNKTKVPDLKSQETLNESEEKNSDNEPESTEKSYIKGNEHKPIKESDKEPEQSIKLDNKDGKPKSIKEHESLIKSNIEDSSDEELFFPMASSERLKKGSALDGFMGNKKNGGTLFSDYNDDFVSGEDNVGKEDVEEQSFDESRSLMPGKKTYEFSRDLRSKANRKKSNENSDENEIEYESASAQTDNYVTIEEIDRLKAQIDELQAKNSTLNQKIKT